MAEGDREDDDVRTVKSCCQHPRGGGFLVSLDDNSMIFAPNDKCAQEPKLGEDVRLLYFGSSYRITGILIGGRDYGSVPWSPQ